MDNSKKEFIEEMSESDKIVLSIVANSPYIKSTRLQKIALITKAALDGKVELTHGAYLFGGFSDDIDESVNSLRSEGFLVYQNGNGFSVNEDGKKLFQLLSAGEGRLESKVKEVIELVENLSDKQVTALTYKLFPQLTGNSIIKEEMNRIGKDLTVLSFDIKKIKTD
jgi:hypothetical protein